MSVWNSNRGINGGRTADRYFPESRRLWRRVRWRRVRRRALSWAESRLNWRLSERGIRPELNTFTLKGPCVLSEGNLQQDTPALIQHSNNNHNNNNGNEALSDWSSPPRRSTPGPPLLHDPRRSLWHVRNIRNKKSGDSEAWIIIILEIIHQFGVCVFPDAEAALVPGSHLCLGQRLSLLWNNFRSVAVGKRDASDTNYRKTNHIWTILVLNKTQIFLQF